MHPYFISCDWGTSSFRLRVAETKSCTVLAEISSTQGIASTYQAYLKDLAIHESTTEGRFLFYLKFLKEQLRFLSNQVSFSLHNLPLILSGMASSSLGMLELPYADLPFPMDGSGAVTRLIPAQAAFPHDMLLISGLRSMQDVMRGEETQITGLFSHIKADQAIYIFPGTHCKHIYADKHCVTGFRTYMTGELFQVIANHTILQASVAGTSMAKEEAPFMNAFRKGVQTSLDLENILHALFTVRTGELFRERDKQENYYYLSGLLIGKELMDLLRFPHIPVYICSSSHLVKFYEAAAETLHLSGRTNTIPARLIDEVVVSGQWQIWQQMQKDSSSDFHL